jgi:hypothetical protein
MEGVTTIQQQKTTPHAWCIANIKVMKVMTTLSESAVSRSASPRVGVPRGCSSTT